MERIYSRAFTILPSMCDSTARLGIPDTFAILMDVAAEHAEALSLGAYAMAEKNLFWLTVRTKILFHRRPALMREVKAYTWPSPPGKVRCERCYTLRSGEELLIEGKTEWAVMETDTGRLHRTDEIYPAGLSLTDETAGGAFSRVSEDFSDAEELGAYTVRSTDIDLGGHMNNAAYIRALFGVFSCDELKALRIREVEASFRLPCYEGDELVIRRRKTEEGMELGLIRHDGRTAFTARIV